MLYEIQHDHEFRARIDRLIVNLDNDFTMLVKLLRYQDSFNSCTALAGAEIGQKLSRPIQSKLVWLSHSAVTFLSRPQNVSTPHLDLRIASRHCQKAHQGLHTKANHCIRIFISIERLGVKRL